MIISYKHNFILLSCPKTASNSTHAIIEQAGLLDPNDISTGSKDGTIQINTDESPAQNIPYITYEKLCNEVIELPIRDLLFKGSVYRQTDIHNSIPNHNSNTYYENIKDGLIKNLSIKEIQNFGLINTSDNYDAYIFLRDPIQRYISGYFYLQKTMQQDPSIEDLLFDIDSLMDFEDVRIFCNRKYSFYLEPSVIPLQYENLEEEITKLVHKYGGEVKYPLPRLKSAYRPLWSKEPIETWMPKKYISKLQDILKDDIETYNKLWS